METRREKKKFGSCPKNLRWAQGEEERHTEAGQRQKESARRLRAAMKAGGKDSIKSPRGISYTIIKTREEGPFLSSQGLADPAFILSV